MQFQAFHQGRNNFVSVLFFQLIHQSLLRGGLFINHSFALFANPLNYITLTGNPYPGSFIAFGANQHHIRDVNGRFKAHLARVDRAAARLDLALVFGAQVDTLHHHPLLFGRDFNYFTAFASVLRATTDHFDRIALTNFDFHGIAPNFHRS
jgi:hypothetical protein